MKATRTLVARALSALLGLFALDAAGMYLSADRQGQALIYPYYSVRSSEGNAFNTYVSISNHGPAKVVRVRFREGRNGREVASFNLILDFMDTWAGAIVPTASGARLVNVDGSCTDPAFTPGTAFVDFTAAGFTGANADGLGEELDRTREGYVEVIEMATLDGLSSASCDGMRSGGPGFSATLRPSGGLSGTLTLINVASGLDFTLDALAIADLANRAFYRNNSDPYPDFDAAEIDPVATFVDDGRIYRATFASRVAALDALLMAQRVVNEVVLDAATLSRTDWVLTMPTRRFHAGLPGPVASTAPFSDALIPGTREIPLTLRYRGRDGAIVTLEDTCPGLPCPSNTHEARMRLSWASSVLTFRNAAEPSGRALPSDVFGSTNAWRIDLPVAEQSGSASIAFGRRGAPGPAFEFNAAVTRVADGFISSDLTRISGLPVVGFMARTLRNGNLVCSSGMCQGNYGGAFAHRRTRLVTP